MFTVNHHYIANDKENDDSDNYSNATLDLTQKEICVTEVELIGTG